MDHTITLPNSKVQVSFRIPKVSDKRSVIRSFTQDSDVRTKGYNYEEAISAKCITKIDGKPVNQESDIMFDPFDLLDDWDFVDQQFYLEVFSNLNFLDEKGKQKAAEVAKKILVSSQA